MGPACGGIMETGCDNVSANEWERGGGGGGGGGQIYIYGPSKVLFRSNRATGVAHPSIPIIVSSISYLNYD